MDFFAESITKHTEKLAEEEFLRFVYWKPRELYRLLGINPPTDYERESLRQFFRRPWFSRLWMVQEFIMAKEHIFVLGNLAITSSTFQIFCRFNRHVYNSLF